MADTTTALPRVYTLGFRAGQTLHQLWGTVLSFAAGGASGGASSSGSSSSSSETFALSNKLWWRIQEETPELWSMIANFPVWYKTWWMELLHNDPVHLFVETTLLLSVAYMILTRTKDYGETSKDKLTTAEEDDLIKEWRDQTRAPLAKPASDNSMAVAKDVPEFVVHKVIGTKMQVTMDQDPVRYDVLNFGTFDFLGFSAEFTAQNPLSASSSGNNDDASNNNDNNQEDQENDSKKKKRKKKNATANKVVNNTDGMNPIKKASIDALERYGCGACGPRGFYGTIAPHLRLEEDFTKFMGTDGAILYSDGASTVSSTIAAFCKRGDILVVDEGVREPIIAGVKLSRAHVKWFKHNDMDDMRRVLESVNATDKKKNRKPDVQRRFIICEGLYKNTGLIAPLDKIVAMKHEFHYRLILDESYSFGTLGETGRGALELYDKKLMHDAEIVTIALENSLGSIGGMTIGNEEVVDHQRLSGSGYCFSAASPPFTASAAIASLHELKTRGKDQIMPKLNENKQYLYDKLRTFSEMQEDLILISSDIRSPIVFLVLAECAETVDIDETVFLSEVVRECIRRGLGTISAGQHNTRAGVQLLRAEPQPSIRMSVTAAHTKKDIDFAVQVLSDALGVIMKRYVDGEI